MKAVGYAVVIVALVGGSIFVANLLSGLERQKCGRTCPGDPNGMSTRIHIGPLKYEECMCR